MPGFGKMETDMGTPEPIGSIWEEWNTPFSEFQIQEQGTEPNGGV